MYGTVPYRTVLTNLENYSINLMWNRTSVVQLVNRFRNIHHFVTKLQYRNNGLFIFVKYELFRYRYLNHTELFKLLLHILLHTKQIILTNIINLKK